jgi:hypothetical protein
VLVTADVHSVVYPSSEWEKKLISRENQEPISDNNNSSLNGSLVFGDFDNK